MIENIGIIQVDRRRLAAALGLPEGAEIVEVWTNPQLHAGVIKFKVRHASMPLVDEGLAIPVVSLQAVG